ncbi:hypothetical protein GUITHDRAFT_122661 [Guillardia theta CCMP2712]|uniref:Transcription factor TFIIIC triple barrel domain-containing protein n=1 Tax=Guillardia theta (strain CCMP2712) TaxID=905079 RepID=L1I5G9_GUITC|nr:hypothetical protein GUITHDRAFT_122661 [Guillardia theta CCMP2712]EKX31134.1 hypothetical protein GUITHDRAFT_122661 [Guillardia theta CCMP2712]|eukprot:XP_005818114.1 hypothetical protein GUITHDRAFT_122661 [Guillardia theta CCMP2712]
MGSEQAGDDFVTDVSIEFEDPNESIDDTETLLFSNLDTPTPCLRVGDREYEGHYEYVIGTHLYFSSEGENGSSTSPAEQQAEDRVPSYQLIGKTCKKIVMRRVGGARTAPAEAADKQDAMET